ncbi:hypothetical protein [Solitalea canadensis]|uniref:BZIP transcription factor n=1 Tax=Solitalea canadensis (strain ATCC 29591 / DSM 3403 / JCM 21819 / LMG 8368 / NBRC 15130 / NCIMB 12057 / USAM 9D) TaxID=929556 RepID=H8KTR8_SOLCM|nr:hypothetical protein [Solitalea canadensis]AFD06643.1 hypothetical protein Solca_1570 [Solitalea canadensis DSM 3403]
MKKLLLFIIPTFLGFKSFAQTNSLPTTGNVGIGTLTPTSILHLVTGGQGMQFGTGTNTSPYAFSFGLNDDGINFSSNSTVRGYNFKNANGSLLTISHNGKVGIGTATPFTGSNNFGLHIDAGDHSSILLGNPISGGYGGIVQTSDNKHRVFIGANLYDDKTLAWKSFQTGKGTAGISIIADNGGYGTGITMYVSDQDNAVTPRLTLNSSGNMGIGTTTPVSKLQVVGTTNAFTIGEKITGNTILDIGLNQQTSGYSFVQSVKAHGSLWGDLIINEKGGNVGIGTTDTKGYKLAVAGNMVAEQVTVKLKGNWPDYVFTPTYNLPSLQETEQHIKEKGHLPGIPSAEEVKNNGVDLGEMNAKLLQKIEELTLHLIEMQKDINQLKKENQELKVNKLIK